MWTWRGEDLYDADGELIAAVRADMLTLGSTSLLLEHNPGAIRFRLRATSTDGTFGTIHQRGLSIGTLVGHCGDQAYELRRQSMWAKRRDIVLDDGRVVLSVEPRADEVTATPGPAFDEASNVHKALLTWACVLADVPREHRLM